jgi:hypothetical protein
MLESSFLRSGAMKFYNKNYIIPENFLCVQVLTNAELTVLLTLCALS